MKGKIKYIQERGEWSNNQGTFNKYQVSFDDGKSYQFLAKGSFKKGIGDFVEYEVTNEKYGTAKLIYTQPAVAPNKDQLIIRQSMVKAACDFHANRLSSTIDVVLQDAEKLINFINK
ncbi:MAG: hypothetical protein GOVbin2950_7 [Prokaryotic dsDNA virus sp.]|nr:MAG: hypothetical protein GOVbin2950_7 [Prokaryotic dsDNA virus sp.]|tara:strand:- start:530 stop:880 length:351 start_codon:yes stop_codon:yes gene_type:complete